MDRQHPVLVESTQVWNLYIEAVYDSTENINRVQHSKWNPWDSAGFREGHVTAVVCEAVCLFPSYSRYA